MATEAPAQDRPPRDRHHIQTLILAITTLATVLIAVLLAVAMTAWLNRFGFLHFPLGYYLLAQGLLIFMVAMGFWFVRLQERIDQARNESEGLG